MRFTGGTIYPVVMFKSKEEENYFLPKVQMLKSVMKDRPIILQGGIRNPSMADEFIKENVTDFIALSRPLVYEPNLPNRWMDGDLSPPLCTNCNSCLNVGATDTVYCVVKKKSEKKT